MRGLIWFKKDLRISDNPALYQACEQCEDGVIAVYVIDLEMWREHGTAHCQIEFILQGLQALQKKLATLNISLIIKSVANTKQIPEVLFALSEQYFAEKLFFNAELEINESRRDLAVTQKFFQHRKKVAQFNDQLILLPEKVQTNQKDYFKVFTPFKRQWLKIFQQSEIKVLKQPKKQGNLNITPSVIPSQLPGISSSVDMSLWPSGEIIAYSRLDSFLEEKIFSYQQERDYPFLDATSRLSPYLALGMISVKTCFLSALHANKNELDTGNQGAIVWMSELIWREFYRHVLVAVPRVCMNKAYKIETDNLPWSYDENLLHAWQQGRTGFPLVDAAMRQLKITGWMHNRLRMVTAMFLSKNLFLDWRLGERYFAEHLIDFDFASNNGGWQWSASTGTDAVPYFRIFNPITQSEKFDASGDFIRYYCAELKDFDGRGIHDPYRFSPLLAQSTGYPRPVIDYRSSRQKTINAFKKMKT